MSNRIDGIKQDMLKEIGNIGMGNAANSLSILLKDEKVNIFIPEVAVVSLGELPDHMGNPENVVAGIYTDVGGDISMHIIFILPQESACVIAEAVTDGFTSTLDEMGLSAVCEVGNIVTAGYLNAISDLTGFTLMPSPPCLAVDITEAILGTILAEAQVEEDFVILIKTSFMTGTENIQGYLSLIPAKDSFDALYQKLIEGI